MTNIPGAPLEAAGISAAPSAPSVPSQRQLCGVAAPTTTAAGVSADQPRATSRSAIRARWPSPISTTSVALPGASPSSSGA